MNMNKASSVLLLVLVSSLSTGVSATESFSQAFACDSVTTPKKEKKDSEGYWGGISISAVSMAQFQGNLEDYDATWGARDGLGLITDDALSSWRLELNPFEYRQRILGEFVGFTTGLGFDWWHVGVDNEHILQHDEAEDVVGSQVFNPDTLDIQKNNINAVYLRVPMLVSLRTSRSGSKGLHVEAGFVGAYMLGGSYQYEYRQAGSTTSVEEEDFPINPLQINARIGVGFKNVSLLAEASLLPFFEEEQVDQPTMHAFSLGLQFAFND
jgi:hypothetical protein